MSGRGSRSGRRRPLAMLAILVPLLVGCSLYDKGSADRPLSVDERLSAFDKGADRPPTPNTLYSLARLLASQGRDVEAERVLSRLTTRHPDFVPAYCDLAELQVRHRRMDEAIRTLSSGLKRAPRDAVLLNNLGMCWLLKGDYQRALEAFTAAAGIVPQDARYRANMAAMLGMTGRYEEALALYQQVLPRDAAHHNVGVLCEARGDHARAEKEFKLAEQWKRKRP